MTLTSRQWDLYNLLKSQPNKWFTQEEICKSVDGYTLQNRKNDRCPTIREDKIVINESLEVDKIIVMDRYCFKIGTREEYLRERAKHVSRLKAQKAQIENMDFKYKHNMQGKLLSNRGEIIDEQSRARKFFETFISEEY